MSASRVSSLSHLVVVGLTAFAAPAAAETRSFVASMLYPYMYNKDGDCEKGLNPLGAEQDILTAAQIAQQLGWPKEKVDALLETSASSDSGRRAQVRELLSQRSRIDGKAVNADVNPQAAPDPNAHMITGKLAYGFNLDDRGANDPSTFTDPVTGERGVDNQLFRALGCFASYRGDDRTVPGIYDAAWTMARPTMPAWLVTLEGDDLSKDGDVTVTFDVAFDHAEMDAQSRVLAGMTFRVNPNPVTRNVFKAVMRNGVITATAPGKIHAIWGEQVFMPKLELNKVQLRLNLRPNNTLDGIIGGYMPYTDALMEGNNATGSADWISMYWNLRKAADADPDPTSGRNQSISATFKLEAVPAFAVAPPSAAHASR